MMNKTPNFSYAYWSTSEKAEQNFCNLLVYFFYAWKTLSMLFSGLSYCCPHFRNNFVLNWVCPLNGCGPLGGRWVPRWRWKGGSGVGGGGHGTPCHLPPLPSKTHLAISHIVNYHPSLQKPTFIFTSLPPWHCQLQTPSLTSNTPTPSLPGVTHLYPGHNINNTYNQSGTLWASWISKKSVFVKWSKMTIDR